MPRRNENSRKGHDVHRLQHQASNTKPMSLGQFKEKSQGGTTSKGGGASSHGKSHNARELIEKAAGGRGADGSLPVVNSKGKGARVHKNFTGKYNPDGKLMGED